MYFGHKSTAFICPNVPKNDCSSVTSSMTTGGVWLLIPARAGSKGIPGKNVRPLNGVPLIRHVVERMASAFPVSRIVVSTDGDTIAHVVEDLATIHDRSADLAEDAVTLDEVACDVAAWLQDNQGASEGDILLTIQPTSPFLSVETVRRSIETLRNGAASVLSVRDDRHLRWTVDDNGNPDPLFDERINRQWMKPIYAETGGVIGTTLGRILEHGSRVHEPVGLVELDEREGLDIDTYADWAVAEYFAQQKRIVIRADSKPDIGMGHVHRAVALAQELADHDLRIVTRGDGAFELGANFLAGHPYETVVISEEDDFFEFLQSFQPDITITDILDTEASYMRCIQNVSDFVVALEDLGEGARHADIVINDLYTDLYPESNHWYGVENSVLSPVFETVRASDCVRDSVQEILVTFGGTDPKNLTEKTLESLALLHYREDVTVVLGPGYAHGDIRLDDYALNGRVLRSVDNMALVMREADVAVTSGGRTVTELMTLGVPTIVCCQNTRELRHTHASSPFGVINLGLGEYVEPAGLAEHLRLLLTDPAVRIDMRDRALQAVNGRSNRRIVQRILDAANAASNFESPNTSISYELS